MKGGNNPRLDESTMTARKFQYLGTSDEVTTCDCCGKVDLKNTVAIQDFEGGDVLYFGVTCAAKALKVGVKEVKTGTAAADRAKEEAARAERERLFKIQAERWTAHLIARTGGIYDFKGEPSIFDMIQKLGGIKAAREGFSEESNAT